MDREKVAENARPALCDVAALGNGGCRRFAFGDRGENLQLDGSFDCRSLRMSIEGVEQTLGRCAWRCRSVPAWSLSRGRLLLICLMMAACSQFLLRVVDAMLKTVAVYTGLSCAISKSAWNLCLTPA